MKQVLISVDQYLKMLDFGSAKKHPYTGIFVNNCINPTG